VTLPKLRYTKVKKLAAKRKGKTSYRKKTFKRAKKDCCKQVSKLAGKVGRIEKSLDRATTTYDYRVAIADLLIKPVNQNFSSMNAYYFGKTSITNVMGVLEYWDDATQAFVARNTTGTADSHDIYIKEATSVVDAKNNYQVPVNLVAYVFWPKTDTSTFPNTTYDAGVADIVTNAAMLPNNDLIRIEDIKKLKAAWTMKKLYEGIIAPGETVQVGQTVNDIDFNPTTATADTFQRKLKSHVIVLRLHGCPQGIAHNTVGTFIGQAQSGLDVNFSQRIVVKYDGGMAATRLNVTDSRQAIGTTALMTANPYVDNVPWSIT
jgi:hypothetical protein